MNIGRAPLQIPDPAAFSKIASEWLSDGVWSDESEALRNTTSGRRLIHSAAFASITNELDRRGHLLFDKNNLTDEGVELISRAAFLLHRDEASDTLREAVAHCRHAVECGFSRASPMGNSLGVHSKSEIARALRRVTVPKNSDGPHI